MGNGRGPRSLDRTSPVPLWTQLLEDIRRRSKNGEFVAELLAEMGLVAQYEVSRNTVREAMRRLRSDGVVVASRGGDPVWSRKPRSSTHSAPSTACSRRSRRPRLSSAPMMVCTDHEVSKSPAVRRLHDLTLTSLQQCGPPGGGHIRTNSRVVHGAGRRLHDQTRRGDDYPEGCAKRERPEPCSSNVAHSSRQCHVGVEDEMCSRTLGSVATKRTLCSFCGKGQADVRIVAGPNVWICDECVQLCCDIVWPDERFPWLPPAPDG